MGEDLWRIDEGGERDDAPPGQRRSAWTLASWSGDRRHEVEVVWPEWIEEVAEAVPGVAEALADPPGRRGLRAVLEYLAAEHPPERIALTEDGLATEPRWIVLGAPREEASADGRSWRWELRGPEGSVTVAVVESPALAGAGRLAKDIRDARSSRGLSILTPLLDRPRLPGRVLIAPEGVQLERSAGSGSETA